MVLPLMVLLLMVLLLMVLPLMVLPLEKSSVNYRSPITVTIEFIFRNRHKLLSGYRNFTRTWELTISWEHARK